MAKGNYQIPFRDGSLQHYPVDYRPEYGGPVQWVDNYTFSATMTYQGFKRGRSAAYVEWSIAELGHDFPMFLTDLSAVLRHCDVKSGRVTATWTFCKRGQNYGLRLAMCPDGEATP